MTTIRPLGPFLMTTILAGFGASPVAAADCAKTPQEAWTLTQKAAKTRDLGEVLARLTPTGRGGAAHNVVGGVALEGLSTPEVTARFAAPEVQHTPSVREAWALLERLEAAAIARGWEGGGGDVDEIAALAVGMGDLSKPLVGLTTKGETASTRNDDDARIDFPRLGGCWLIDGNEWIHD